MVGGPGKSSEISIYEIDSEVRFIETYPNPAITAPNSPGIWMLNSALDHGADCIIVSGAGGHVFDAARGKIRLYVAIDLPVEEAVKMFREGKLLELSEPSHHGHHSVR